MPTSTEFMEIFSKKKGLPSSRIPMSHLSKYECQKLVDGKAFGKGRKKTLSSWMLDLDIDDLVPQDSLLLMQFYQYRLTSLNKLVTQ